MSLGFPILFLLRTFPKNEKEFSNIYIYILAVFTLLVVENQYPSPETPFDSPFFILIVYMKEKKVLSCTKSITVLRRFQIIIMLWPNRAPPSPFSLIDKDHEHARAPVDMAAKGD